MKSAPPGDRPIAAPEARQGELKEENTTVLLTGDMKRVVEEQRLGYVATVCPDGTPNLSPKGTIANLRLNPSVDVNVVDPFLRKGYRFKGVASVLEAGAVYDQAIAFYRNRGSRVSAIREIVLVRVESAAPIDSPAYDLGLTEDEVRSRWENYFQTLRARTTTPPVGE